MAIDFGPVIAAMLLTQIPGGVVEGKILDPAGGPVAGADVVFYSPPPTEGQGGPVQVSTRSDAAGHYRLEAPTVGQPMRNPIKVWAYKPGLSIAGVMYYPRATDIALGEPGARSIEVVGPDGKPVAGVEISPRAVLIGKTGEVGEIPESLAATLAAKTGPDGRAAIPYLSGLDGLRAIRIRADALGSQDLVLGAKTRPVNPGPNVRVQLTSRSHLSGRVRDAAGHPLAGHVVEVWSRGGDGLAPGPVVFPSGPVTTKADGGFRTPDGLLVGSSYRVAIRKSGFETVLSKWIALDGQPHVLPAFKVRELRIIRGVVRDRRGQPLEGVEVFQSGDGPERTTTRSDGNGRFSLGGFLPGPAFVFARRDGFRFLGRLVRPGEGEVALDLTRDDERPAVEMRMLPPPIPDEESRALARRLLLPCLKAAIARKDQSAIDSVMFHLATVDPELALEAEEPDEEMDRDARVSPQILQYVKRAAAISLARTDPGKAMAVAETVEPPDGRLASLLVMVDALPQRDRARKAAWITQAEKLAREVRGQYAASQVAERWLDLGEKQKAHALLTETLRMKPQDQLSRSYYASRIAPVDLPAALAIAREMPADGNNSSRVVYEEIVSHLAADDPVAAEKVLGLIDRSYPSAWFQPVAALKMARTDPDRARRLNEESQRAFDYPTSYLFLALGLKDRDPVGARDAFRSAMSGIDRRMKDGVEYAPTRWVWGVVLPIIEEYDPAFVPEFFWRAVASRPPLGNPRATFLNMPVFLSRFFAFYDREVASAVFDPVRLAIEQSDDAELASRGNEFNSWAFIDPHAAVNRLDQVPVSGTTSGNYARTLVAGFLGIPYEARWRRTWAELTEMRALLSHTLR